MYVDYCVFNLGIFSWYVRLHKDVSVDIKGK